MVGKGMIMEQDSSPLISVIIATFNYANYISEAVASALAQQDVNLEVIVVDDGSTDDTSVRLIPYMDRIRYIPRSNGGPAAARNTGIREASGKYIAFLDADDIWLPWKLALQASYLETHPDVDVVCTDFSGFDESRQFSDSYIATYCTVVRRKNRRFDLIFQVSEPFFFNGAVIDSFFGNVFDTMLEGYFTLTSTVMLRRTCIDGSSLFNEERSLLPAEDFEYYLRLARRHNFAYLDTPTTRYRVHQDQTSRPSNALCLLRVWLWCAKRVRAEEPEYYATHRAHLDRVIWRHEVSLARSLYWGGQFDAAAAGYLRSLRMHPWYPAGFAYLLLALIRSTRQSFRRQRQPAG